MVYTLTNGGTVIRDSDGAFLPDDPGNIDFQAYQAWVAAGNTPTPAPAAPAPPVDPGLAKLQAARSADNNNDLKTAIEAILDYLGAPP